MVVIIKRGDRGRPIAACYGTYDAPVVTVEAGPGDMGGLPRQKQIKIQGVLVEGKFHFAMITETSPDIRLEVAFFLQQQYSKSENF